MRLLTVALALFLTPLGAFAADPAPRAAGSLLAQVKALSPHDTIARTMLLDQAALLATTDPDRAKIAIERANVAILSGDGDAAPAFFEAALALLPDDQRGVPCTQLVRHLLANRQLDAANALCARECSLFPESPRGYELWARVVSAGARTSADWVRAADLHETARLKERARGVPGWGYLTARLRDLRKAGRTDAQINAIAIPILTAGNVTYSPGFAEACEEVNRALLSPAELRGHLTLLLQTVNATPDAENFRGVLAAQLAALPQ